ncbi:hypothetical protein [Flavobacterium sp. LHD-85]|uniref:hypothetical protein n=1 Tax=Flavobacterium sp. LHD-85 TaxID=3071410 RepID=UPI0027DED0EE|nr:hypothetical protein [Flavobacterium sp. LHD-85]MDQ6531039.1 hypothetical protein [Flavobacterium sp. LHD-85]
MKFKYSILLKLFFFLPLVLCAQNQNNKKTKTYEKLEHLTIDKIIYYQTPYYIYAHKPVETDYKPSWYWGYCAKNYPPAFKDYAKEANSFILPPKSFSEKQLKDYEAKFKSIKPQDYPSPNVYCYSEIYFTYKKTKKQYLMVLSYELEKEIPNMQLNKVDTLKFKIPKDQRMKSTKNSNDAYASLYDAPTHINYYVLDSDGIYKEGDNGEIYLNIIKDGNSNFELAGNRFDHLLRTLKKSSSYIRSYITDGTRYFETDKPKGNGVTVIGSKRKKP